MKKKEKTNIHSWANSILDLVYPRLCTACTTSLLKNEEIICAKCLYDLPETNYTNNKDNPVARLFWSMPHLHSATALYFFRKENRLQDLLHALKYNAKPEVGQFLGQILGQRLADSPVFESVDFVLPVPLHPAKRKKRGYNQSEEIVKGISEEWNKKTDFDNLVRTINTQTQTKKTKEERLANVQNAFALTNKHAFENKHVLLIDDVITTGSTLLSIAEIFESTNSTVSMASLAFASY